MNNPQTARLFLRRLTDTAAEISADLPAQVVASLKAEPPMPPTTGEARALAAQTIADAAGKRDATKRVDAALDVLARSEAAQTLRGTVVDRLSLARLDLVEEHAEEIVNGFRRALASDFDALNRHAAQVPPTFDLSTSNLAGISPDVYAAQHAAVPAAARIEAAAAALGHLAEVPGDRGTAPVSDYQRLAVLDLTHVAESNGRLLAFAVRGLAATYAPGNPSTTTDYPYRPGLWFAAAAAVGARFALADVETRASNAERFAVWRSIPTQDGTGRPLRL